MLRLACPSCGTPVSIKEHAVGRTIYCPKCGHPNFVPAHSPAAAPAAKKPDAPPPAKDFSFADMGAHAPPAGDSRPRRRKSLALRFVLLTAFALIFLAVAGLAVYAVPRYLKNAALGGNGQAQASAKTDPERTKSITADAPVRGGEAPPVAKAPRSGDDAARTKTPVAEAPKPAPADPALVKAPGPEEVKTPPVTVAEPPAPPVEPTPPAPKEEPLPKPPPPPVVKEPLPPPPDETPKPKDPPPTPEPKPSPPEPSIAAIPRDPVVFKRRNDASDEDLRKQLLSVSEFGLDQGAASAMYAPLLDLQKKGQPLAGLQPDYGPRFLGDLAVKTKRPELTSMPWRQGVDCQLGKESAERLHVLSLNLRSCLRAAVPTGDIRPDPDKLRELLFQGSLDGKASRVGVNGDEVKPSEWRQAGAVPALTQMLQAENTPLRLLLVEMLSQIEGKEASDALVRRALFDLSPQVREKAVQALADRPTAEYQPLLLAGFRYPWPAAADHAAEALMAIKPSDALPPLIDLLNEPDPQLPFMVKDKDKDVPALRELVRVNHLSNCMLCHAPSLSKEDLVRGRVPVPGEDPPPLYYAATTGLFVKADTTFLKQDFSVVQPVASSGKWPGDERFDYFLRTRPLSKAERTRYDQWQVDHTKRDKFAQREAVLVTLKELSGKDLGSSYEEWKPLLKAGATKD